MKQVVLGAVALLAVVTGLHFALNVDWARLLNRFKSEEKQLLNVAFIPVT